MTLGNWKFVCATFNKEKETITNKQTKKSHSIYTFNSKRDKKFGAMEVNLMCLLHKLDSLSSFVAGNETFLSSHSSQSKMHISLVKTNIFFISSSSSPTFRIFFQLFTKNKRAWNGDVRVYGNCKNSQIAMFCYFHRHFEDILIFSWDSFFLS